MKKIYELNLEVETEVFRCSNLPNGVGEIWFHFDSSILVELTRYFVDKKIEGLNEDFIRLVKLLSSNNINISPIAILETARDKAEGNNLNRGRGVSHTHALLMAQCVDIEKSDLSTQKWLLSESRVSYLLSQHKNYVAGSLIELAEKIFLDIKKGAAKTNNFSRLRSSAALALTAAWRANKFNGPLCKKLEFFRSEIPDRPYLPKIIDYCIHLISLSATEDLLQGGLRKIATELDNTTMDIVLFELFQMGHFSEPFDDLKIAGAMFTCDKNMYYFAKLGRPLILALPGYYQRIYYPDFSYLRHDKKSLQIARSYFNLSSPDEVRDFLLQQLQESEKIGLEDQIKFANQILSNDFSRYAVFKSFAAYQ